MDQLICNYNYLTNIDATSCDFIKRLADYYESDVISPQKDWKSVMEGLSHEYRLTFDHRRKEELDLLTLDSVNYDGEYTLIWILKENENSKIIYKEFEKNYFRINSNPYVYVGYDEKKNVFGTNSQLLQFLLYYYRGINKKEIENNTGEFKSYLNDMYLLGEKLKEIRGCI